MMGLGHKEVLYQVSFIFTFTAHVCVSQSVNVKPEIVASIAGERVLAVSSVVTLDPRRRKFHRPITISVPLSKVPTSHHVAVESDLRLLCSLIGAPHVAVATFIITFCFIL